MKRNAAVAALAGADTSNIPAGLIESGFIDEVEALRRVPVARRTWFDWRKNKGLPYIQIGKRVLYDWPSVKAWLMRQQRGE
jgi:hypothetical protein